MYQVLPHTADVGLRIDAGDLNSLFEEAGSGLFSLIVANLESVQLLSRMEFELAGEDVEYLLLDWLQELLFKFDTEQFVMSAFKVSVRADGLIASAWGERFDVQRHQLDHEVKAITYHGLKVARKNAGWTAEIIIDI